MMSRHNIKAGPGVYMIRCRLDKRTYVGSSKNVKKRIQRHVCDLRAGKHHSLHLQRAWDKYGEDSFEVFAAGYYAADELRENEQFWLDTATCAFNGSRLAYRIEHTEEARAKMSEKVKAAWQRPGYREAMQKRAMGKPSPRKGMPLPPETTAKLRETHRAANRRYVAFGKVWCLKELAETYGVHYGMLKDRLRAGWSVEDAVTTPKRKGGL